ncbi:hypothetical protein ACQPTN_00675 [Bradyrhizobium sp. 13971]|uniref:hypothetical protein n=1 Tax=Bradyrhizobium elkanii TaxID=29448 RepID=UPI00086A98AD|nr:hypothetical protein [Bradyrhizobium elkanii]ODM84327.1 hypothetical protein A6452_16400 [Bradyrhizobium elkanii]ODM86276.1 hypothetical protein A6X20_01110 [Bradyrhizobium elkanii]
MEESMQSSFDKRGQDPQHNYQSFSIKLVALPLLVVVALIGMLVSHPAVVRWISDAAQAEFVGTDAVYTDPIPNIAQVAPTVRPGSKIRTVKVY